MDAVDVARWQFAITTVYHFLFVPITIGLSLVVAIFHAVGAHPQPGVLPAHEVLREAVHHQLRARARHGHRAGVPVRDELVRLLALRRGHLRRPARVRGPPRLLPRVDFLGIWIFGWGRVPEKLHAGTMWLSTSAPCCRRTSSSRPTPSCRTRSASGSTGDGRAEMDDFLAVLTNKVQLVTSRTSSSPPTWSAARSSWASRCGCCASTPAPATSMYRKATRFGAVFALVASLGVVVTGDIQGKIMTEVQPMKMAAAEGLYETTSSAPFSVLSVGTLDGSEATRIIEIPACSPSSPPARGTAPSRASTTCRSPSARMAEKVAEQYGPDVAALVTADSYAPIIPLTYWSFRFMMGLGFLTMLFAAMTLWAPAGAAPRQPVVDLGGRADPLLRSSPTAGAGSSPRSAGSRGSSTAS